MTKVGNRKVQTAKCLEKISTNSFYCKLVNKILKRQVNIIDFGGISRETNLRGLKRYYGFGWLKGLSGNLRIIFKKLLLRGFWD